MPDNDIIKFDYTNMMAAVVGPEHGVTKQEIEEWANRAKRFADELAQERGAGKLRFRELPDQHEVVEEIKAAVDELKTRFDTLVVLGIGGSALGNIALQSALNHPYWNLLSNSQRNGFPRLFVMDNIDPDLMHGLLDVIDVERTLFNVITKSGETAETMSQFMIVKDALKRRLGSAYAKHIVATTDAKKGYLREIVDREKYRAFIVPDGVGGRFSVLSAVGLFSAAMTGIDIAELLAGAAAADKRCSVSEIRENPAHMGALLQFILDTRKGEHISVMMPYSQALRDVADWFRQLWAESLGKKHSLDGQIVHTGPTPVKALGVTDQHSQVQLYAEGPFDKVFTFLGADEFNNRMEIPRDFADIEGVAYLGGHTLNELMKAEQRGTQIAITEAGRPNCTITLPRITPYTVGQLLYTLQVQTAFAGKLYNINAFDQPGVEAGKVAAYALMGRKGFEDKRREIEAKFGTRQR